MCDFLQDENGRFHFLKISDFQTDGQPVMSADWKISTKFTDRIKSKALEEISKQKCSAGIICRDVFSELKDVFERVCRGQDNWFNEGFS